MFDESKRWTDLALSTLCHECDLKPALYESVKVARNATGPSAIAPESEGAFPEDQFVPVSCEAAVLLHTSNALAKQFFRHNLSRSLVVLFSGDSTALELDWVKGALDNTDRCRFVPFTQLSTSLQPFVRAWHNVQFSEHNVPWAVLEGLSTILADKFAALDVLLQGALTILGCEKEPPTPWGWAEEMRLQAPRPTTRAAIRGELERFHATPAEWFAPCLDDLARLFPDGSSNDTLEAEISKAGPGMPDAIRNILYAKPTERGEDGALLQLAKAVVCASKSGKLRTGREGALRMLGSCDLLGAAHGDYVALVKQICS